MMRFMMKLHWISLAAIVRSRLLLAMLVLLAPVFTVTAAGDDRTGKEIVDAVCRECHGTGVNGAPKIGDANDWIKRASQGLRSLTAHAVTGIRLMPAHGGSAEATNLELSRAITYMVNQSGGQWTEPISKSAEKVERTGEQVVALACIKCHKSGEGGAPKIGDHAAWIPRVKHGLDPLVLSAIRGHGGMPARGGVADLTDNEVRNAIIYMFTGSK